MWILFLFIIELILLNVSYLFPFDVHFCSLLFVVVNSFFVLIYLLFSKPNSLNRIIVIGFFLRFALMYVDYNQWIQIPHSGTDTETFHCISENNQVLLEKNKLTNYTDFLTILYSVTNSSRLIAQYVNVLLGIGVLIVVRKCMFLLNISLAIQKRTLLIIALLPNFIIFSGILLREAWVEFFTAISVLYFIRWFIGGKRFNLIATVMSVLLASYMHAGVIGVLIGYIFAFMTYNPLTGKVQISRYSIISIVLLTALMILFTNYSNMFLTKFYNANLKSEEDFIAMLNNTGGGGSDYLTWINTTGALQGLFYTPLKMFYFLFSPLPTEWRGISDLFGFLFDGMIYLILFISIIRSKIVSYFSNLLKKYLLVSLFITIFIFAFGTSNAGTAFRHRAKILSLIVLTFAIAVDRKKSVKIGSLINSDGFTSND